MPSAVLGAVSGAVLGIDASGSWCSAALVRANSPHRVGRGAEVGSAHSGRLLAMVGEVLDEESIALNELDAIAFAAGPGSFTGLRIACAVAQGLAFGASLPVVPVGTLDAIAQGLSPADLGDADAVLVAMDARMGEVYWAILERDAGGDLAPGSPALGAPAALARSLRDSARALPIALGCGDAWRVHGAAMDGLVARRIDRAAADAADVAALGLRGLAAGHAIDPADAAPLYVRNDIARTTAERAAGSRDATSTHAPAARMAAR